ncbi:MAG: penicillin-binding transpeptidase domain-containing protein, partial [Pseudomonadota bacterium]
PIAATLRRLGATRDIPAYPSMLLGAVNFTPYEVAGMYQTLAAGGFRSPLRVIREVLTADGEPLRRYPVQVEQTLDGKTVQILNSALQEVPRQGTARALRNDSPEGLRVAGKTGTTDDLRDSWFAGFNASHLGVVWLGRDDNQPTGLTGASGALQVWGEIFAELPGQPLEPLPHKELEYHWIDPRSGRISEPGCPGAAYLAFIKGTAPQKKSDCAGGGKRRQSNNPFNWFKGLFQ